jgi:hypothetical protein
MTPKAFPLRSIAVVGALLAAFFVGRASIYWQAGRMRSVGSEPVAHAPRGAQSLSAPANGAAFNSADSETDVLARRVAAPVASQAAEEERRHLIERWAERDPRAAVAFARTQLKGDRQAQAMSAIISIWGKNDPAAAWAWVKAEMPSATYHFDNLLEVFGHNSPELAGRYAAAFAAEHPEATLEVHLAALLGVTFQGDFAAARAIVDGNASLDPTVRGNLDNFIAGQWARYAPNDAAKWVLSLPAGPQRDQALIGLGESWSEVDPARATEFAAAWPEGETRSVALRQGIAKWVEADPAAAREWVLKTDRQTDFDQAVQAIATQNNFMNREPARAIKWAATIFDDTLRAQSVSRILYSWYPNDPAAATAYLQSSQDLSTDQRAELLRQLQSTKG